MSEKPISVGGEQTCRDDLWAVTTEELNALLSETGRISENDKRWRILEHGCQWVSWTPTGGETVSFDPRSVKYLQAMRKCADETSAKHVAILREGANAMASALNPAAAWPFPKGRQP